MAKKKATRKPRGKVSPKVRVQDNYEGKRKYPRIAIDIPVTIKKINEEIIEATIHDISIDGLQIRCDHKIARILYPSGKFIQPGKGPYVRVKFSLPVRDRLVRIKAQCQLYYVTGLPGKQIAFGMLFRKFSGNSGGFLEKYIMDYIEPIEDKVRTFLEQPRTHRELSDYLSMETYEVEEVVKRLKIQGDIVMIRKNSVFRHIKLSSLLGTLLEGLDMLENRLKSLEEKLDK